MLNILIGTGSRRGDVAGRICKEGMNVTETRGALRLRV